MNNIQQTLFQTIETITDSKLNQMKFDKTIEAIVVSNSKSDVGEYELKYQDLLFIAYSSVNTVKFDVDENVYVLVPDGDMGKRKTIISSSAKEGEKYVDFDEVIDRLGVNLVNEPKDFEIELSTTFDETVSFNIKKQLMIDSYPTQRYLSIGAEIITNISNDDIDGLYGISIDCVFINDRGERIPHTFEFNSLNVTGNPFQSRGYKETQIPLLEESLIEVVGARAFSKGFSAGIDKIKFRNINIDYVNIRNEDKSEYTGNIIAPRGLNFRNNVLYPDEKLQLIMELKQKGEILDTKGIQYRWFLLNSEVSNSEHPDYHPDAGIGWEWLKQDNYDEDVISGLGTSFLQVSADFVPSFATVKCIATYEDRKAKVASQVTLVDYTESIKAEIDSSNGESFVNGDGKTILTCLVTENSKPVATVLNYHWTQIKEGGAPVDLGKNVNSILVDASTIGMKSIFICSVKSNEKEIAKGQVSLVNVVDGSSQGIVIVGGFRTALYDANGKAPTDFSKEGFNFDVYDNGEKINSGLDWTWKIPSADKTLLTLENGTVEDGYQTTKNKTLYIGLVDNFDYKKNDNSIKIEVKYTKNGLVYTLIDYATISITKVGQNGADGAAGRPGLDGSAYVYEIQGGNSTITYDSEGANPVPQNLNEFFLMFSKNSDINLAKEVDSVSWELPPYEECLLSFNGESSAVRKISTYRDLNGSPDNPHKIKLVADGGWSLEKYNNVLSAKFSHDGMIFREYHPISVSKNGIDGEMGYTIITLPSSRVFHLDQDGKITNGKSFDIDFEISDSSNNLLNFNIDSYTQVQGLRITRKENLRGITVEVIQDSLVPNSGKIEIILSTNGKTFKQLFTFSSVKDGDSVYEVSLYSTNGLIFKRGDVNSVIYAIVRRGMEVVNEIIPQSSYTWSKINKEGQTDSSWVPTYYNGQRDKIVITPKDITERATFECSINI